MANKQIKQLNEQATLASNDLFVIQDGTSDETKKATASTIASYNFASGGTMSTYTPTITTGSGSITAGNGYIIGAYSRSGKMVTVTGAFRLGSTSTWTGTAGLFVSLPINRASFYDGLHFAIGTVYYENDGVLGYNGICRFNYSKDNTKFELNVGDVTGSYIHNSYPSSTVPFTWGSLDFATWTINYLVD